MYTYYTRFSNLYRPAMRTPLDKYRRVIRLIHLELMHLNRSGIKNYFKVTILVTGTGLITHQGINESSIIIFI